MKGGDVISVAFPSFFVSNSIWRKLPSAKKTLPLPQLLNNIEVLTYMQEVLAK